MKLYQPKYWPKHRRNQAGFSLIELLIVVAIIGILAAVALPKLQENLKLGRETAAIQSLGTIHTAQAQFNAMRGKFGLLKDLSDASLVGANFSSGTPVSQYKYSSPMAEADKYCVQATRMGTGTAYRDFNVIEDGTIRASTSKSVNALAHGDGVPISQSDTGPSEGQGAAPKPAQ